MRKLDRPVGQPPQCLSGYHHTTHKWDDVGGTHKAEVRLHLEAMQGRRCAYCEGDLDALGQHIEHFRRKHDHPMLTFDWANLYWSCDQTDSCGHFKDRDGSPYNVADLIDPCCDDPDRFFLFRSDGTISLRNGLSLSDQHRATETLRVFSLDANWGRLRKMRKAAVSGFVLMADEAVNAGFSPMDIQELFETELNVARSLPFSSAIRHVLTER